MTDPIIFERLARGEIVRLSSADWQALRDSFATIEEHDTQLAGALLIVQATDGTLAAVEAPTAAERVVRRLADRAAADAFVEERLATYNRMWDGCGCKVDYYG